MLSILYCLLFRYLLYLTTLGTSQAVHRNLWYIKSPLLKLICLHGSFAISAQKARKTTLIIQCKRISNKQAVFLAGPLMNKVYNIPLYSQASNLWHLPFFKGPASGHFLPSWHPLYPQAPLARKL
jgi:hypothetical protein